MTRLHVLLGAGGVGKTTLAAGCALALARHGARVGLLGIDPSERLQGALGLELRDVEALVPGAGELRAAILHPHQAVHRWVVEGCADASEVAHVEANPFFTAVGDRLASATDVLAAVRIAEWLERDPALDELVVDTAPGLSAVGFLHQPRVLAELLEGPLIGWLRLAAPGAQAQRGLLRFGARRILAGFAHLAGSGLVGQLADFFASVGAPLHTLVARLERAQALLRGAELLLVTSPRDSDASGARQLFEALALEGLAPRAVIVNRTWPLAVCDELAPSAPRRSRLLGHARAYALAQARVMRAALTLAPEVITAPSEPELELGARREALLSIGEAVRSELARTLRPPEREATL